MSLPEVLEHVSSGGTGTCLFRRYGNMSFPEVREHIVLFIFAGQLILQEFSQSSNGRRSDIHVGYSRQFHCTD